MIAALLKLSRWQEFIPWTLPLTLLGALMAYRYGDVRLDGRLLVVAIANILAVAYAFMVNDIEDAEDDRYNPHRAPYNAITAGELSVRLGWSVALITALLALMLFASLGTATLLLGGLMVVLGHLYSWHGVRLKALPVVDILSHILMLSALIMATPYWTYHNDPSLEVWSLLACAALFSAYGQLYNQYRDFEADRTAKLRNTASLLGKPLTQLVSYGAIVGAVICLAFPIISGAFPYELGLAVIASLPIAWYFGRGRDMRGDKTEEAISQGQVQFLIVMNAALLIWLAYVLIRG